MKKIIVFGLLFITIIASGCTNTENSLSINTTTQQDTQAIPTQPDRKLDLYGKILSMEGNEFTIQEIDITKDPTFNMETEEKQAYMAGLSEDQRMALKEEIRTATLGNVSVLIPVGIPVVYKTAQGPEAESALGSLEDLKPGSFISVRYDVSIVDKKVAEYVKKSRSN